jgi:phenylalanyl-tRNA synthetase beta chain
MEYSLSTLYRKSNLGLLNLSETINRLNLIGFEVDEVTFQKNSNYSQDIKFLLKSPANRDDLFIENLFLSELELIFLLEIYTIWKKIKNKYFFLLKKNYIEYSNYQIEPILGNFPEIISYVVEISEFNNIVSPIWIQKKLIKRGIKVQNNFQDILELIHLEWGYKFKICSSQKTKETFKIEKVKSCSDFNNNQIFSENGIVLLRNQFDVVKSILGIENNSDNLASSIYIEGIFYNIHENKLNLTANNTKLSFRDLRKHYLSNFKYAFQRLLTLIEVLKIGKIGKVIHVLNDCNERKKEIKILKLEKQLLKNVLNLKTIDQNLFKKSGLSIVSTTSKDIYINIPYFRNDLTRQIDLVEEYSRFIGYANFPEILPKKELKYSSNSAKNVDYIKQFFINHNFNEVYTNPLEEIDQEQNTLTLLNPLNKELSSLQKNLFKNLTKILETNIDLNFPHTKIFEIGRVFKIEKGKIIEQEKLAGLFDSSLKNNSLDWFIQKGFLENFLNHFGYMNVKMEQWENPTVYFHPTKSVRITYNDKILGVFGEINPKLKVSKSIKSSIYIFEFNLIHFKSWRLNSNTLIYKEYSKYPVIQKDISISIKKTQNFYKLKQTISENISDLKTVQFFDIYFDPNLEKSEAKLGIRLEFQSVSGTLTNQIIEEKLTYLQKLLKEYFDVTFPS